MKKLGLLLLFLGALISIISPVRAQSDRPLALVMQADGPIMPPILDYIQRGIKIAEARNAEVLIIQLNTPGGSITTMLNTIKAIRESNVPIVVYVAPRNAFAGSAGAPITFSAHVSAMAPETFLGASTPIDQSGENLNSDERTKAANATKAAFRSYVEPRGKEALTLAESTVDKAVAVTAKEALDVHLIDFIANDTNELLKDLDGFTVQMGDGPRTLHTANATQEPLDMSLIEQLLLLLTNPNFVFSLFSIGILAIVIEVASPGGWVAGFFGVICVALSVYGMGVLTINWFGIVFLATAFVLFILDIKAPTHGALTLAGVASFIVGSLVLFNSAGTPEFQRVSVPLIVGVGVLIGAIFFGLLLFALRAMHNPVTVGVESIVGKTGTAKMWDEASGQVQLQSELWSAEPVNESERISKGDKVEVVEVQGLRLKVRKIK